MAKAKKTKRADPAIKVDENKPAPGHGTKVSPYVRAVLAGKIGCSVLVPYANAATVNAVAHRLGGPGWFECQAQEDGVRIWKKRAAKEAK